MPPKLQNFLSLIQTYLGRLEDEPNWGHLGEAGSGQLINAAINLTQKTKGDKGAPKTAEESFESFAAAISYQSEKPMGPGRLKTLKEIWEVSGKPYIKLMNVLTSQKKVSQKDLQLAPILFLVKLEKCLYLFLSNAFLLIRLMFTVQN